MAGWSGLALCSGPRIMCGCYRVWVCGWLAAAASRRGGGCPPAPRDFPLPRWPPATAPPPPSSAPPRSSPSSGRCVGLWVGRHTLDIAAREARRLPRPPPARLRWCSLRSSWACCRPPWASSRCPTTRSSACPTPTSGAQRAHQGQPRRALPFHAPLDLAERLRCPRGSPATVSLLPSPGLCDHALCVASSDAHRPRSQPQPRGHGPELLARNDVFRVPDHTLRGRGHR